MIPRLHLFELEDQPWFPSSWRNFMTDYLRHAERKLQLYRHALEPLQRALTASPDSPIVDLCSGAGGLIGDILRHWRDANQPRAVTLTDLYPNREAFEVAARESNGLVRYRAEPVDARVVPAELRGLRTLFNGFHHFRPAHARAVLADAVQARQPIAVFEVMERSLPAILSFVLVPLFVLLFTPFIRPFRWSRLFWTYLVPVLPMAILWDGVVSSLRAYTPDELLEMGRIVEPTRFRWDAGYHKAGKVPGRMTYLLGVPVA